MIKQMSSLANFFFILGKFWLGKCPIERIKTEQKYLGKCPWANFVCATDWQPSHLSTNQSRKLEKHGK